MKTDTTRLGEVSVVFPATRMQAAESLQQALCKAFRCKRFLENRWCRLGRGLQPEGSIDPHPAPPYWNPTHPCKFGAQ